MQNFNILLSTLANPYFLHLLIY